MMATKTRDVPPVEARAEARMAAPALKGVTKALAGIVERRNTIPILSNFMLKAEGKKLLVNATDLDLWASAAVDLEEPSQLCTTVSARTLGAILAEVPSGQIELRLEARSGRLELVAGRADYRLPALPPEDWPKPPEHQWAVQFEMPAADVVSMLAAVSYAESSEETRYYLNGIFLHAKGKQLKAAATDGHRLAVKSMKLPEGAKGMPDIIIPRKAVAIIMQIADRAVEPVSISVSAARIKIEVDGFTIHAKLIDGTFPDYTRVIPSDNEFAARADPAMLLAAVKRVTAIATERTRAVKFSFSKDRILAETSSAESGHAREDLQADYAGADLSIGFNRDYVLDILGRAAGDALTIKLRDSASPALFEDHSRPDLVQVLMPMRV